MFCLLTIEGGDVLTFFATLISGAFSALAVILVFFLTRDFQKKQDNDSREFQEKQDKKLQVFQEKQAKESNEFQKKLAKASREFQEQINQKNLEHDYKTNQPYFKFENLKIFIKNDATYNNHLLFEKWLYPDDKQRELLNNEGDIAQLNEYLRFRNIGKGLAIDIEISIHYDYNTLLENAVQMDINQHQLQHQFEKSIKNKDQYKFIYGDYNREIYFYKRDYKTSSSYKYRIVNSNEYIEIPLQLNDTMLFNYYLCYLKQPVTMPKLKICISYYDIYNHKFTDEIDLEFKVRSTTITSSNKNEDEHLKLIAELDEADNSKLKTIEVNDS